MTDATVTECHYRRPAIDDVYRNARTIGRYLGGINRPCVKLFNEEAVEALALKTPARIGSYRFLLGLRLTLSGVRRRGAAQRVTARHVRT